MEINNDIKDHKINTMCGNTKWTKIKENKLWNNIQELSTKCGNIS